MSRQQPGEVNQRTFLQLVEERLAAMPTPRNPEEMDRFRQSGAANGLRQQVAGGVEEQATRAQQDIRSASEARPAPVASHAPAPLPPQGEPPRPAQLRAQEVLPPQRDEREVSLDDSQRRVENRLSEEQLDAAQLREANDPRFYAVQQTRENVREQSERAPREYREAERADLERQGRAAEREEQATTRGMSVEHERAGAQVEAEQRRAMTREEQQRREVSERIERIFNSAQERVQHKLAWLDGEVERRFNEGEARARRRFEGFVETEMRNWKIRRYGRALLIPGIGAAIALGRWIADKLTDINRFPKVRAIYDGGRLEYVREMRAAIIRIAGVVEESLRWCEQEIRRARAEIQSYVQGLPQSLRQSGEEASRAVSARFDHLRESVNQRREALANRLVERYRQARQQLDRRINQMQEANRGLVNRFVASVREVVGIIANFRRQLLGLVGEARDVVNRIARRPVNFVHNLVRALRLGFNRFNAHIGQHLRAALLAWLFGTLAQAGINVPATFDLRSIIGLILRILGITTERIRAKVARIVGERNMALLEHAWRYVSTLVREGPIGLWNQLRQDLSNLWDMALQTIREWVIAQLVRAAVARLVSMFNPAGAIIQAALAIYNALMFFVERVRQIMELVRTVVGALDRIERGDLAQAADRVEQSMARTLPLVISFFAGLLGLSGISDRIRGFIERIQTRVDLAIDAALERIVSGLRRLFGRGRDGQGQDTRTLAEKERALQAALNEAVELARASSTGPQEVRRRLPALRAQHRLTRLELIVNPDNTYAVEGAVNPSDRRSFRGTLYADSSRPSVNQGMLENLAKELPDEWSTVRDRGRVISNKAAAYLWVSIKSPVQAKARNFEIKAKLGTGTRGFSPLRLEAGRKIAANSLTLNPVRLSGGEDMHHSEAMSVSLARSISAGNSTLTREKETLVDKVEVWVFSLLRPCSSCEDKRTPQQGSNVEVKPFWTRGVPSGERAILFSDDAPPPGTVTSADANYGPARLLVLRARDPSFFGFTLR